MGKEMIDGRQVSDEHIRQWANEAEDGYDIDELRRCGRPSFG